MSKCFLIAIVFCLISFSSIAQDKIEREKGVKAKNVPIEARNWLEEAFVKRKRSKWYQEFFEGGYSYEAKFLYQDQYYSVEFDSLGNLEDIEIELKQESIPKEVYQSLSTYFEENYSRYRLKKIQIQYSGSKDDLKNFVLYDHLSGVAIAYEIEFEGKNNDGKEEFWEGLFDEEGLLVSLRKINLLLPDNLIF